MGVSKAYDPVLGQWVKIGRTGPQGPPGALYAIRSDSAAPYTYLGQAPWGSAEADAVWRITRVTLNPDGSALSEIAINVAWTDRGSVTYG